MKVIYLEITLLKEEDHVYGGELTNKAIDAIVKTVKDLGFNIRMVTKDGDDGRPYVEKEVKEPATKKTDARTKGNKKGKTTK